MTHTFTITISRKPGLSDPEGATTKKALTDLGFTEVEHVSFGRVISLTLEAADRATAIARVEDMCARLLANPVMESFEITETA